MAVNPAENTCSTQLEWAQFLLAHLLVEGDGLCCQPQFLVYFAKNLVDMFGVGQLYSLFSTMCIFLVNTVVFFCL